MAAASRFRTRMSSFKGWLLEHRLHIILICEIIAILCTILIIIFGGTEWN